MNSEKGCVRIYGAGINQEADDDKSFSQIMIDQVEPFFKSHTQDLVFINEICEVAIKETEKIHPQQTPCFFGGRRLRHFPFAINQQLLFGI